MSEKNLNKDLEESLVKLYANTGPERVGFIVDDEIVEVANQHPDPANFFDVAVEDIDFYEERSWAIWHTQPKQTSQLSYEDYSGFLNFPHHKHIVIGGDGLRIYKVENGAVIKDRMALRRTS